MATNPSQQKEEARRRAYQLRRAETDRVAASGRAMDRLVAMAAYQASTTILWYVDCRSELQTRTALGEALKTDKRIVVPYCTVDQHGQNQLGLWRLQDLSELKLGKWNILEPPQERWSELDRDVSPDVLDCILVPGVAFTRQGDRLGSGHGYYDRLNSNVRADCVLVGVCFECQLFDTLAVEPHDAPLNFIVTEESIYAGRRA